MAATTFEAPRSPELREQIRTNETTHLEERTLYRETADHGRVPIDVAIRYPAGSVTLAEAENGELRATQLARPLHYELLGPGIGMGKDANALLAEQAAAEGIAAITYTPSRRTRQEQPLLTRGLTIGTIVEQCIPESEPGRPAVTYGLTAHSLEGSTAIDMGVALAHDERFSGMTLFEAANITDHVSLPRQAGRLALEGAYGLFQGKAEREHVGQAAREAAATILQNPQLIAREAIAINGRKDGLSALADVLHAFEAVREASGGERHPTVRLVAGERDHLFQASEVEELLANRDIETTRLAADEIQTVRDLQTTYPDTFEYIGADLTHAAFPNHPDARALVLDAPHLRAGRALAHP